MENALFKKLRFLAAFARHEDFFKDSAFYYIIGVHIFILFSYDTDGWLVEI
jgi:hypothetical protein